MKLGATFVQWIFALIFIIGSYGFFSESILTGVLCFLFGCSLAPFPWKNITLKNKKTLRIAIPAALFLLTIVSLSLSTPGI